MVKFVGETFKALSSQQSAEIHIEGKKYDILPKTLLKLQDCSNAKEYVESMEFFAYQVLVTGQIPNEGYFQLIDKR